MVKHNLFVANLLLAGFMAFSLSACTDDDEKEEQKQENNNQQQNDNDQDPNKPNEGSTNTTNVSGTIGNHDYIDLGLPSGLKWATYNLGATSFLQYGGYYAWGETTPWQEYTKDNYVFDKPYCNENKILYPKFDAATSNWGNYWRMPTFKELEELINNCSWKYFSNYQNSGIAGFEGSSKKNSNIIFLPASGLWNYDYNTNSRLGKEGYYRASDFVGMASQVGSTKSAMGIKLIQGLVDFDLLRRADGIPIRPVTTLQQIESNERDVVLDEAETARQGTSVNGIVDNHTYVDLGFPSGRKWATYNIGATSPEQYGNYYAWGETKPKAMYTWENYKYFTGYDEISNLPQLSKYVRFNIHGSFDNKLTLDREDDAAAVNWGNGWHMPTQKDFEELINGCIWKRVDNLNGSSVTGWVGYSKYNSMKIYLPSGGFEYSEVPNNHLLIYYLSADLYKDEFGKIPSDYDAAVFTKLNDGFLVADFSRIQGYPVRAVHD